MRDAFAASAGILAEAAGSVVTSPRRMLIYLITDRRLRPDLDLPRLVDQVSGSGADMVQLREKDLPTAPLLEAARRAAGRPHPELLVNGRVDVALTAGADGVHLP